MECKTDNTTEPLESISTSVSNEIQSLEKVEAENQGDFIQSVYGGVTDSVPVECVEPFPIVQSDRDVVVGGQMSREYEFIPFAPDDLKPYVGMQFKTQDDAIEFYNAYANACGFSIRKNWIRKSQRTGEIIYRVVSCSKEGKRHEKYSKTMDRKRAPKAITRIGCLALIGIAKKGLDCWEIKKFDEKHCHDCVALTKSNALPSHRKMSDEHLSFIRSMKEVGVGDAKTLDFPINKADETDKLDYVDRNTRNALTNQTTAEMSVAVRRDDLSQLLNNLSIVSSKSARVYEFVKGGIKRLLEQVEEMNKENAVSMEHIDSQGGQCAVEVGMRQNSSLDEQCAVEVGVSGDSLVELSSSNIATNKRIKSGQETDKHASKACCSTEESESNGNFRGRGGGRGHGRGRETLNTPTSDNSEE